MHNERRKCGGKGPDSALTHKFRGRRESVAIDIVWETGSTAAEAAFGAGAVDRPLSVHNLRVVQRPIIDCRSGGGVDGSRG
ncbi:hypothetical protein V5799_010966 [Amblyomma americanum]|uniref:Uncharacterized protein n=1 Tax=Amblyomma americanum TaxID=6943 RepID=A0AAQ4EJ93_AMBAM